MPGSDHVTLPAKWIIGPPAPTLMTFLARTTMFIILLLVGHWVHVYLGGVALQPDVLPDGSNNTGKLFNWHPILMTLAFAVFMAEAVLTYQAPMVPGAARPTRKKLHSLWHSLAAVCAVLGVTAAFKSHSLKLPTPIPDLYSPHSLIGLTAMILFGLQFLAGMFAYLWPQASLPTKLALSPLHKFGGRLTWVAGLAAMATGLQEKTTFVASGKALAGDQLYGPVIREPAVAALLLVFLAAFVLYHHAPPAQPVDSDKSARTSLLSGPTEDA